MTLSKPALMSAFLCPGIGQWAAGQRVLGFAIVTASVVSVGAPLVLFLYALIRAPFCDMFELGIFRCMGAAVAFAWRTTGSAKALGLAVFGVLWIGSVAHAARLSLPERS